MRWKKKLFNIEETDQCDTCHVVNDLEHLVLFCEKYDIARANNNLNNRYVNMQALLKKIVVEKYRSVVSFCREAGVEI